ncbi:hypothetical protein SNEBB_001683 [Seison nebaliae]|nr:hypothetical protein SNEBB_001683 [Seison nebaliae]
MKTTMDDNRDPNNLHEKLTVEFDDIFGEPEGIRSCDCAWNCTHKIFDCWKSYCYKLIQGLCCCCLGCGWATVFACIAFEQIWIMMPFNKCLAMCMGNLGAFISLCTQNFIAPWYAALGAVFSNIKITKA